MPFTCSRCEAPQEEERRFCTRCGYEVAQQPVAVAAQREAAEARFVACHACGATNAASRRSCGRCGMHLDEATATASPEVPEDDVSDASGQDWEDDEHGSPVVFVAAIAVAGAAIIGVIFTILTASGVLTRDDDVADEPEEEVLAVSSIRASSVLDPVDGETFAPENLLDDDPATVWIEAASGRGVGEWIELELGGTREVTRLLVWNGDQREGEFSSSSRVGQVRIEIGERTFTADLLDIRGPQAIDLPEVVEASSLRVTILEVAAGGTRSDEAALSGIEVRGPPRTASDT